MESMPGWPGSTTEKTMDTLQLTPGREYFLQPITTRDEAEQFILRLQRDGISFHFDDAPEEVVNMADQRVFTDAEAAALRPRVAELFALMDDPHAMAIAAVHAAEGTPVYRLERLTPNGAMVETGDDARTEYHVLEGLKEAYPDAGITEIDEVVGSTTGIYYASDVGAFQLTRLA